MKSVLKRSLALILALMLALSACGALAAAKTVAVNEKNFPDAAFRAFVQKNIDKNRDNKLTSAEIKAVKEIDLTSDEAVKSLTGIKYFTNLRRLYITETSITMLDLRKNTKLTSLTVDETPLKTLKLGKLKNLKWFCATDTALKSIDISGCAKLMKSINVPNYFCTGMLEWDDVNGGTYFSVDKTTKLMNGKKLLRKYTKPTKMKFSKKSVTFKANQDYIHLALFKLVRFTPSYAVYPCTFTNSSNKAVCTIEDDGYPVFHKKGATTLTLTAANGGPSASIKVTVK